MARGLGRAQGTESARGPVQAVKQWQWPRALIKAYKKARNERLAKERQRMADIEAFVQAENQTAQDQREQEERESQDRWRQEWLLKQQLMVLRGEYQDERLNGGRTSSMVELNRWDKWLAENNNKLAPLGEDSVNDVVVGAWQEGYKIGREEGALFEQDNRRAWREEAYGWGQLPEAIIAGATVRDLAVQHNCGEQHIQEELHKQRKRRTPRKRPWGTRLLLAVVVIGG